MLCNCFVIGKIRGKTLGVNTSLIDDYVYNCSRFDEKNEARLYFLYAV